MLMLALAAQSGPTSIDYAAMGKRGWDAFRCSVYAQYMGEDDESDRLLILGYAQMKEFVEAVDDKQVRRADLERLVPNVVIYKAHGFSTDFKVGRIYEAALDRAADQVYLRDIPRRQGTSPDADQRRIYATNYFEANDCRSLGGD